MVYLDEINSSEILQKIKEKEDAAKRELSCFVDLLVGGLEEIAPQLDKYLLSLIDLADFSQKEYREGEGFVDSSNMWFYSLTSKCDIWCQWQEMPPGFDAKSDHYILTDDVHGFLDSLITSSDDAEKYIKKVIRSVGELNQEYSLEIKLPKIFSSYREARKEIKVQA
ncbi:MAG: hypothetical protein KAI51_01730 [Candidatus Aenigmarchaeota archaeon]|nr:hypothetical protein [Candidatus Aenigmarchaeota archaeon]